MKSELDLIRKILADGIPFLGICLGLQTMVKAAGGQVIKSPLKEIGFRDHERQYYTVGLTESGREDPLFDGIDGTFKVFHLHAETVLLTEEMKLLAEGRSCRNQIVKVGRNAYGIQCHFELTPGMFKTWVNEDPDLQELDIKQLNKDFNAISTIYSETGRRILENFVRIAGFI